MIARFTINNHSFLRISWIGLVAACLPLRVVQAESVSVYLSDLVGESVLEHSQQWGTLGTDSAAFQKGQSPKTPLRIGEKVYEKGLGHHATGEIAILLEGRYESFDSDIGVQWQGGNRGSVVFQVFVDGEKRFESEALSDSDPPQPVVVPLADASELRLVAASEGPQAVLLEPDNAIVADGDREYKADRVHGGKAIPTNADPRDPNRPGGTQWIGKQRYQTTIGDSFYILPFQYNPSADLDNKRKGWVAYNPQHWTTPAGDFALNLTNRAEERNCAGCHQQGVHPELVYNGVLRATQFNANAVAPNIGCENCHGPGGNHPALAFTNPHRERGIVVPSMLGSAIRRLEACGRCHTRGQSVGELGEYELEYPFNSERTCIPGDVLADFYTDGGGDWPDGTSRRHHQQYLDYFLSKHWKVAKFECWECHDPHGSDFEHDLKMTARDNSLCPKCHSAAYYNASDHTHHSGNLNSGSPRCVDCHMAAVQVSGLNYDIHHHTFRVLLPQGTIPSSTVLRTVNRMPVCCVTAALVDLPTRIPLSGTNRTTSRSPSFWMRS